MTYRHRNRRQARQTMKRNPNRFKPSTREHVNVHGKPKHKFTQRGAAEFVAHRPHMHAYRCPTCGAYHVARNTQEPNT